MRLPVMLGVVPALLLSLSVGCGPSSGGDATPDGGTPLGEGGTEGGTDGGTGDGATSPTCTVLGTNVLGDDVKELSNLSIAGNSLVFLSADLTLATPPGIEKIQQDGTGRTALYTPAGNRRVHSLHVAGDRVFFFESDTAAAVPVDELWSMPVAGGTPTRLGTDDFGDRRFVGSDATYLYVSYVTNAPIGARFDRIDMTTGAVQNVAIVTDRGTATQASLSGNDIFFFAGGVGGNANVSDIFRFDKNGSGVTPTILPGGTDALCDSRLGGLYATPTKLACGFGGIKAGGRDGSGIGVVVPRDQLHPSSTILVGSDVEMLYLLDREQTAKGTGTLRKVASSGGALLPVACDLSTVQNPLINAVFPVQNEYELVIGSSDVFWIEHRGSSPSTKWFVRRAPK